MKVLNVACLVCFIAVLNLQTTEASPLASPVAGPAAAPAAAPEPHKRKFGRFETIGVIPVAPVYYQPAPVYVQPAPVFIQPRPVIVEQPIIQPIAPPPRVFHKEWSFTKTGGFWK